MLSNKIGDEFVSTSGSVYMIASVNENDAIVICTRGKHKGFRLSCEFRVDDFYDIPFEILDFNCEYNLSDMIKVI